MHSGPRTVVAKAMNAGFYWPRMYETASEEINKCDNCQVHAPMTHHHKHPMIPVSTSWPFQKWAIDIIGPFPEGPVGVKCVVVAIDYFTKWVEARPLEKITGEQMSRFVLDNIICRYGVPNELVSDSGVQFAGKTFRPWYEQMHIHQVHLCHLCPEQRVGRKGKPKCNQGNEGEDRQEAKRMAGRTAFRFMGL
ncbi:putative nucleotidyltransferase, Ribonuclease H [Helianthus annuus]|nr:putative nucleotidyltransferase, Ribonuclease H [Helianthus annuus]